MYCLYTVPVPAYPTAQVLLYSARYYDLLNILTLFRRLQQDGLGSRRSSNAGRRRGAAGASSGASGSSGNEASSEDIPDPQASHTNVHEEVSVRITPAWVVFFVFCMCAMLVLLYFFFTELGKMIQLSIWSTTDIRYNV